ncbi:MAG: phosphoribosylformimino-5-aminoimidazole carboxamide ribotide isomerase [Lachnospiraceae bacterium]|nr:phosphoribosylformimino-5-aminoimidazole carboxamide ribotide isomerase [Lachnospiraceae bacterium]
MEFRPCIDIHDGKVKQIVGGSLNDTSATTNFESDYDGAYYADYYEKAGLSGGHIILLNPASSPFYEEDRRQAFLALHQTPKKLQIGGGVNADNAPEYIKEGASHVIVTSYVFKDGKINYENLEKLKTAVGKEHIVLDLSCRKKDGDYYIVTDRWQKFTDVLVNPKTLESLLDYADEFLIHAADVEGKCQGIEEGLIPILNSIAHRLPVTYAGGIGSYEDLRKLKELSNNRIHVTIGSALDLFGGKLSFKEILAICAEEL